MSVLVKHLLFSKTENIFVDTARYEKVLLY